MKKYIFLLAYLLFVFSIFISDDLLAASCETVKEGDLYVTPTEAQFYVNYENFVNPEPINVTVGAFVVPEDVDDINELKQEIDVLKVQASNDDCATTKRVKENEIEEKEAELNHLLSLWQNNTDFCWTVEKSDKWILLSSAVEGKVNVSSQGAPGIIPVTIDVSKLPIYDVNATKVGNGLTRYRFDGNVTVEAGLNSPLTDPTVAKEKINIPVTVYLNYTNVPRYAAEKSFATTDWVNIIMNIPVAKSVSGALYILAEHPTLAPGQVFAYRYLDTGAPTFTLFSQWGHPVKDAEKLWYVQDVQNTPIAIPYTENMGYVVNADGTITLDPTYPSIPSGWNNWPNNSCVFGVCDDNNTSVTNVPYQSPYIPPTLQDVIYVIPVQFGAGLRLIGMEGDWIIRAVVGDPYNITNYASWRELFYYVLHIHPITGNWIVTETQEDGTTFTYIDPCKTKSSTCGKAGTAVAYPLVLNENRGKISGYWKMPNENTLLSDSTSYSKYANKNDELCSTLLVQGHRLNVASCVQPSGYEIRFTEPSLWGLIEYFYNVKNPVISERDMGRIEGEWQYQFVGSNKWSLPLSFYAVKQEITIPLDPSCNCYPVNGKVNGMAVPFIVDTGAFAVLLDLNDICGMDGLCDAPYNAIGLNAKKCDENVYLIGGVGGTINAYKCYVDIELEERLLVKDVEAYFSEGQSTALLGMTFLDKVNMSISSEDATMVLAP